jgi:RNA polymerase sigma factor (sigma-70 family)
MSDAELLDRFASRTDEASEAAFEELVIRHGPMVLRVCRSVLGGADDAEDAFQATFLVLANRAGTIRRRASLASWLFGVAQRVSRRVKRGNARTRGLIERLAERRPLRAAPAEAEPDWEVLHAEIEGLPERLRAPLVLCYLEGQTSGAAARRLGLPEPTVRGRLARARERLRKRLAGRGLTVMPAPVQVAGSVAQTPAAVPENLVQSTIRIALGFASGNAAAALAVARGVLNAMLWNQLKVATVAVLLVVGSLCGVWLTLAPAAPEQGRNPAGSIPAGGERGRQAGPAAIPFPAHRDGQRRGDR